MAWGCACGQVDLDMLNVSLGTGTLEICSALLNTEYLSAQLVRSMPPGFVHYCITACWTVVRAGLVFISCRCLGHIGACFVAAVVALSCKAC